MALTPQDWHRRYAQQARWTADLRRHTFQRLGLERATRVIEIGCGTGAVLGGIQSDGGPNRFGLDIKADFLALARRAVPGALLAQADAHRVPFADSVFDAALCHYLLLWVEDPRAVAAEMRRITRPGGAVLALAEPDYGGRLDYPDALRNLGRQQAESLRRQGADPELGRELASILAGAGLREVESGVLGGRWGQPPGPAELDLEWSVIEADLEGVVPPDELRQLRVLDEAAWKRRERILYVPTFYAIGRKPS
ncbi:MAG TPA: methyltransferase domain-containing protein [Anaerolineales bacterium]|nr:methyltransferase domain-containing protein [Anaerolineales bacterium]